MTSEREEIEKVAKEARLHNASDCYMCDICIDQIEQIIRTQVAKARAEERERCAKIAENNDCDYHSHCKYDCCGHRCDFEIAEAIRKKLEKE